MSDTLRAQIYNNLIIKDTEELLEIWQSGDTSIWTEDTFEIVKEILVKRLGYVPPQSNEAQALRVLANVERHIDNNELEKALSECELAIQLNPNSAIAHNYRGEIYEEMGQLENAITNYQRAIQLDPEFEDAWENMRIVEAEIEEDFEQSLTKQHLDLALEYAYDDENEKALQECEMAMSAMPSIATAYNYLGMVLQTLNHLERAIDSYLKAIQLNPRFYAARENLANVRVRWEEEQYLQASNLVPNEDEQESETNTEFGESLDSEIVEGENPIPGWMYLDANAFLLVGWAGHRTRPGRSGYDPLDRDFEFAHMQGTVIRLLITRKFRTRDPIYLLFMSYLGLIYSLPLLGAIELLQGNLNYIPFIIVYSPYWIVGIAFLINVYLSLRLERTDESEDNGYTFF